MNTTYLGPSGATFSAIAFQNLAEIFGIKDAIAVAEEALALTNEGIVPLVVSHRGYGAIAMETKSDGRVDPPVNSFIGLLDSFNDSNCPIGVIGALRMKINFALIARHGIDLKDIDTIIAHPKAIGACKRHIGELKMLIVEADSNGKAAEIVSCDPKFSNAGALAPAEAAEKYGLDILSFAFEDKKAVTTFFLLGPRQDVFISSEQKRSLLVFSVKHVPGALARALLPFGNNGLNLIHVHSLYTRNGHYDFAAEFELTADQVQDYKEALSQAHEYLAQCINFGPFPIF